MFPFNQPDSTKENPSKDCGYRCLYYILTLHNGSIHALHDDGGRWYGLESYEEWLNNFKFFQPTRSGITFTDIATILDYYKLDFRFTHLTDKGLHLVYSGIWLHHDTPPKKHGHYFIYQDGVVYCSTKPEPYEMALDAVLNRLESKSLDHAYRVMKILGRK